MKKVYSLLSSALLIAMALLLAWVVIFTEGQLKAEESLEWTQFLGRFHPVILHLPIGLFLGLVVIEFAALFKSNEGLKRATHILVWLMALTSVLTAYLGLLLASNGDYSGDTLWLHKWLGILFAAVALIVAFFKVRSAQCEGTAILYYRVLMFGLLILLPIVGHYGGNLTHGAGYLTAYAPDWLKAKLDAAEVATEGIETGSSAIEGNVYTQQVQPLLDQYCVQCHGIEKQKSKYRLDTYEYLMTPGSMDDKPIEPYSISGSILLEYMLLPESDDMAMPPEGKPRPSAEEIMMLTHWVANGAEGPPIDEAALAAEQAARVAEQQKLNQLMESGIIVLPLSLGSELLYVDLQNVSGGISDANFELLSSYKDRIGELKLASAELTTEQYELLRGAPELRVLNAAGISSVDSLVDLINSLSALEKLILFGSDLSGEGLSKLSVPVSGALYIGSTKVTSEQLAAYRSAHPEVQVFGDVDLDAVHAIEVLDLENSAAFNPNNKKK